jgi:hypothetical protein
MNTQTTTATPLADVKPGTTYQDFCDDHYIVLAVNDIDPNRIHVTVRALMREDGTFPTNPTLAFAAGPEFILNVL